MNDVIAETEEQTIERLEAERVAAAQMTARLAKIALKQAPEIALHVRTMALAARTERGETLPEWSAPMRITAADDVDEMFARLIEWVLFWSTELESVASATALAWTRRVRGSDDFEPVGFRAGTSPEGASLLVQAQTIWLLTRAERIQEHESGEAFMRDVNDFVWAVRAKYPTAPRPPKQTSSRPCPVCGEFAVGAEWKSSDVLDVVVRCDSCGANLPTLPAQVAKWLEEDDSPLVLSEACVLAQHGGCESVHCECRCHRSHDSGASA